MTNQAKKQRNGLKPVDSTEAKPKRARKVRVARGGGFLGELRASALKHRASMAKLVAAESKLEQKLATVRSQREAAEGPLREVEAILANHPELPLELPLEQSEPEQPAYAGDVPAELEASA